MWCILYHFITNSVKAYSFFFLSFSMTCFSSLTVKGLLRSRFKGEGWVGGTLLFILFDNRFYRSFPICFHPGYQHHTIYCWSLKILSKSSKKE